MYEVCGRARRVYGRVRNVCGQVRPVSRLTTLLPVTWEWTCRRTQEGCLGRVLHADCPGKLERHVDPTDCNNSLTL